MKVIQLKCDLTTKDKYKVLGVCMIVQKLLNDYIEAGKENQQVMIMFGPENFAELWMEDFGLDSKLKEKVLSMFCKSLSELGKE